ncbi:hypothetical protein NIES267_55090 [Calothrix parasitica NIES-267]|uniref:Uncharacterized protein n=1 Tax=Calothrix parasitica NIES-267 TaxID=1973488 RepID=A0A1Z4LXP3_9CYAN|nr:hypothetical protein NIES267_55090 [Calothrix parasitica NIES-267]
MTKEIKENVYNASYKALTENGVDEDVADKASKVVASDDFNLKDLGRTNEDRNNVAEAMRQFWGNQRGEE